MANRILINIIISFLLILLFQSCLLTNKVAEMSENDPRQGGNGNNKKWNNLSRVFITNDSSLYVVFKKDKDRDQKSAYLTLNKTQFRTLNNVDSNFYINKINPTEILGITVDTFLHSKYQAFLCNFGNKKMTDKYKNKYYSIYSGYLLNSAIEIKVNNGLPTIDSTNILYELPIINEMFFQQYSDPVNVKWENRQDKKNRDSFIKKYAKDSIGQIYYIPKDRLYFKNYNSNICDICTIKYNSITNKYELQLRILMMPMLKYGKNTRTEKLIYIPLKIVASLLDCTILLPVNIGMFIYFMGHIDEFNIGS